MQEKRVIFQLTEMDESAFLVSLSQRAAISLEVLAIPSDILHHTVLSGQLVVGREMTDHSVCTEREERNNVRNRKNSPPNEYIATDLTGRRPVLIHCQH